MTPEEMTRLLEELQAEIDAAFPVTALEDNSRYRRVDLRQWEMVLEEMNRAPRVPVMSDSAFRHRR
jgi:hypothetical protein